MSGSSAFVVSTTRRPVTFRLGPLIASLSRPPCSYTCTKSSPSASGCNESPIIISPSSDFTARQRAMSDGSLVAAAADAAAPFARVGKSARKSRPRRFVGGGGDDDGDGAFSITSPLADSRAVDVDAPFDSPTSPARESLARASSPPILVVFVVFPRHGSSSPSTMGCPYRRLISFSVTPDATSRFKSTTAAANSASLHSSVVSFGFPASSHRTYARIRHKSLGTSTASKSTSPFTASARARVVARRRAGRR